MKPVFSLLAFFLLCSGVRAQHVARPIKADVSGILYFTRFQQDSLVPTKRRGKIGVVTEVVSNVFTDLPLKNPRWMLRAGIGYSRKEMVMNKYSLGDALFSFLPFNQPRPDSFRLQRVHYQYDYLNLPAGIFWRLTKQTQNWFQAQVGLQVNAGFCINRNVTLAADQSSPLTPAEEENIRQLYKAGAASVVAGLQPRFDMAARIYKNLGLFYSLQVYTLQLNSFHQRMARGGTGFGGGFGAYLNL
jgi:hypothetical protein